MKHPLYTYGPPELCAWQVAPRIFWLQTRDKSYARKLQRRGDTRKVEICGCNSFQETYELAGTWRKVKRLISRYISVTPDHISASNSGYNASDFAGRVNGAGLPIPLGLVTPDKVSVTTKISADTPTCGTSGRRKNATSSDNPREGCSRTVVAMLPRDSTESKRVRRVKGVKR